MFSNLTEGGHSGRFVVEITVKCLGLLSFELTCYVGFTSPYTLFIRPILRNPRHNLIPDSIQWIPVVFRSFRIPTCGFRILARRSRFSIHGFRSIKLTDLNWENKTIKKPINCLLLLTKS